jgi:4-azaleucine resistance transporter AzlC
MTTAPLPAPFPFTWRGAVRGALVCAPLAISAVAYGIVFGVLAAETGLSLVEAVLMSAFVFGGSAQLVALQIWSQPPALVALTLASAIVNARHLLYGAAIWPWFRRMRPLPTYASLGFMVDGVWAVTMKELRAGQADGAFLIGGGITSYVGWVAATGFGHSLGAMIGAPHAYGLDFILPAFVAAPLLALWRGRIDVLPVATAVAMALAVHGLAGGHWHILAGALAGSLIAAWRHDR